MSTDVGAGALVLAVDLGSTGLKVGYVTLTGSPVWWHQETLVTKYADGAATQDANDWWDRITRAARRGLAEAVLDGRRVVGVGITGQWGSTVPVAADGTPVGDVVMWNDARGVEHSRAAVGGPIVGYAPKPLATWLRRSGGIPNPTGQDPLAHMLHLLRDEPAVAAGARWFLEPVDHLVMRFTGEAAASPMSMIGAWLTDNRDLGSLSYDETLVRMSGVDPARLAPLVRSGSVIGTVLPEVAESLGIAPTAQVATGAPDLHAAVVGSGCVEPFQAHMSIGTTGWITFPVPFKRTDVMNQMASVPGIGDGHYVVANNQDSAGRCLDWFRDNVAGFAGRPPSYEDILALAATAPPGSRGTLFTPWLTGERSTLDDRNARGGFHNVGIDTGRAELARSVLEGVALNARMLLDATERFAKRRLDPIRILGGGARSDLWCQIVADVTDRAIDRVEAPMVAGLRGAGLFVGMALGEVSLGDVHDLVPVDRRFTPDPAARDTYDVLFKEFPKLHSRNRRMFAHLNG